MLHFLASVARVLADVAGCLRCNLLLLLKILKPITQRKVPGISLQSRMASFY